MSRFTEADIVVVGLIGERGREVGNFVQMVMTPESRGNGDCRRACRPIAAFANSVPNVLLRLLNISAIRAKMFADYGLIDPRGTCRREIKFALGEQPTSKGYPPSVISMIPRLVERSGTGVSGAGSITSFYTVLADGDDTNDPVSMPCGRF